MSMLQDWLSILTSALTLVAIVGGGYIAWVKWLRKPLQNVSNQVQPSNGTTLAHIVEDMQKDLKEIKGTLMSSEARLTSNEVKTQQNEKNTDQLIKRVDRLYDRGA